MVSVFIEQEYVAFPVGAHDDMLDALARIAEPQLPLKWPGKRTEIPLILDDWKPLDPRYGDAS